MTGPCNYEKIYYNKLDKKKKCIKYRNIEIYIKLYIKFP